jgi:hypothetical protein
VGLSSLAFALPLLIYVWTASGASYWLDGGEFVAAAVDLDIAHPPGHPLTALYGKAWTLLPLGPLAFRVALGQAMAAALAALLAFRACRSTARALGVRDDAVAGPIGLFGAWLFALGYAVWFQAVRPEVYALQGVLTLLAIERLAHLHAAAADAGGRAVPAQPLYVAAFATGLGLCNHHVMALFMMPALLWSAWTVAGVRRLRPWSICAALGALALTTYVYLPLRAARHPPANFGDPQTWANFLWVVSARVYTQYVGDKNPESLAQRFGDLGAVLSQQFYGVFLVAAAFGLYAALREPRARRIGVLWFLCAAPALVLRPWIGSVRGNPDAIAYMTSGYAALSALASAAFAALASVSSATDRSNARWKRGAWLLALGVAALQVWHVGPQADLSRFIATDALDDSRLRDLPPRSVVVSTMPQVVFRVLELAATEDVRPDVTLLPVPFLRYPGVSDAQVRAEPGLTKIVHEYLDSERLRRRRLIGLAAYRPVMLELDPHTAPGAYDALLPVGALYAVVGERGAQQAWQSAVAVQRQAYARIYADIGEGVHEVETAHHLLWLRYMDALFFAALGQREHALMAVNAAAALDAEDVKLGALRAALTDPHERGQLDVTPFLNFTARSEH